MFEIIARSRETGEEIGKAVVHSDGIVVTSDKEGTDVGLHGVFGVPAARIRDELFDAKYGSYRAYEAKYGHSAHGRKDLITDAEVAENFPLRHIGVSFIKVFPEEGLDLVLRGQPLATSNHDIKPVIFRCESGQI